jgi:hypothetical protein
MICIIIKLLFWEVRKKQSNMYLCEKCLEENGFDLRTIKHRFYTMCESCHKIKVCYTVNFNIFKTKEIKRDTKGYENT